MEVANHLNFPTILVLKALHMCIEDLSKVVEFQLLLSVDQWWRHHDFQLSEKHIVYNLFSLQQSGLEFLFWN